MTAQGSDRLAPVLSVCLGTAALRLLSSKVLRLCQGLARGGHQGAPKHHPEPQANLLGLVRLEGNLWKFPGPKGDQNMRPLALGPELCLLYPLCFSWGKSGCNVHPINTSNGSKRAIQVNVSQAVGTGEFLHGKTKRSHSPQDAPWT